jgi:zinc and cadmium transporter
MMECIIFPMSVLLWILAATIIDGLLGLVGVFSLFMKDKTLSKIIIILVAFSAGALLGGGFFHLLAESLQTLDAMTSFGYLFVGFILFFLVEKFLHWHHCHDGRCDEHSFSYMIMFGDAIHNIIDGLVIAASFFVGVPFGIITTVLIIAHEIPQELGDFGVMVYGGFSKKRAIVFTFLAQLTSVLGGIIGFLLAGSQGFVPFLLPFAAGGFFYIAASDLIPELHKENNLKKSMISFAFFVIGVLFMLGTKIALGG